MALQTFGSFFLPPEVNHRCPLKECSNGASGTQNQLPLSSTSSKMKFFSPINGNKNNSLSYHPSFDLPSDQTEVHHTDQSIPRVIRKNKAHHKRVRAAIRFHTKSNTMSKRDFGMTGKSTLSITGRKRHLYSQRYPY